MGRFLKRVTPAFAVMGFFAITIVAAPSAKADVQDDARDNGDDVAESSESKSGSEYNYSWLDPEKKIYVLQNRRYTKSGHLALSVVGGAGFSNPFRDTYNVEPRIAFFLNETWGVEGTFMLSSNSPNTNANTLNAALGGSAFPSVREIQSQYTFRVLFSPWYAKINVFNSVLYFDWYFALGAGSMQTAVNPPGTNVVSVNQSLFGITYGTGHIFHLSKLFLLRWELTGTAYQAMTQGTTGSTVWYSNYNIGLGIGLKI